MDKKQMQSFIANYLREFFKSVNMRSTFSVSDGHDDFYIRVQVVFLGREISKDIILIFEKNEQESYLMANIDSMIITGVRDNLHLAAKKACSSLEEK